MATRPAAGGASGATSQGALKTWLELLLSWSSQFLGGADEGALVIAAGVITPTVGANTVDTEAAAATDDLTNALTTNFDEGSYLQLRCLSAARVSTVRDSAGGAGQYHMADGQDFVMDDTDEFVTFQRDGADWREVRRSIPNRFGRTMNVTAGVGSPKVLVQADAGKWLENTGAAAETYTSLPPAVAGAGPFLYYCGAAQAFRATAAGADTIRDGANVSGGGGRTSMAGTIGNYFSIYSPITGKWVVTDRLGALTTV